LSAGILYNDGLLAKAVLALGPPVPAGESDTEPEANDLDARLGGALGPPTTLANDLFTEIGVAVTGADAGGGFVSLPPPPELPPVPPPRSRLTLVFLPNVAKNPPLLGVCFEGLLLPLPWPPPLNRLAKLPELLDFAGGLAR
ncbi:hypothetical protein MPER_10120, partial [Moniliophthora perniciosa FA553]